jgi:hypothetical protein
MDISGTVVSLEDWRRAHDERDPAVRLERAVDALDHVLGTLPPRRLTAPDIERELLAITGAVSVGLIDDAADRADRLRERLLRQARKGG